MIASNFLSVCLLVTSALAYPAPTRLGNADTLQNYERSEPIYYYTYLPAMQRRELETQEYARDLQLLEKYVDSLGLEKRGLFRSSSMKFIPKLDMVKPPTRANTLSAPKSQPLAPPPKVEAPAPVVPAPKVEAPKPPASAPAPVVPALKVEASTPPASAPPPPPPPANNPPPSPPPAAPPVQPPAEAPQSGDWRKKAQTAADIFNAGAGLITSGVDAATANVNYNTAKVEAEIAAQASSSSAQPAPTA